MRKVLFFSLLLLLGLIGSQWLPGLIGPSYGGFGDVVRILTMVGLSFIMIRVGYEFDIDKSNLRQYGWDYVVAFTAASFPWILVTLYFVFVLLAGGCVGNPGRLAGDAAGGALRRTDFGGRAVLDARRGGAGCDLVVPQGPHPRDLRRPGHRAADDPAQDADGRSGLAARPDRRGHGRHAVGRVRLPAQDSHPGDLALGSVLRRGDRRAQRTGLRGSKLVDDSVPIHIEVLLPAFVARLCHGLSRCGALEAQPRRPQNTMGTRSSTRRRNGASRPASRPSSWFWSDCRCR